MAGCAFIYKWGVTRAKKWLIVSVIWWFVFVLHAAILTGSWLLYNSSIDAYFVVQAIANATWHETLGLFQAQMLSIAAILVVILVLAVVYIALLNKVFHLITILPSHSIFYRVWVGFFIVLCITVWSLRHFRAVSPVVYWINYYQKIQKFRAELAQHHQWHHQWQINAQQKLLVFPNAPVEQTAVLVLSESLTSYNLNVCGYPRNTTPQINQLLSKITVFCDAYSAYPATIGALKSMLTDMPIGNPHQPPQETELTESVLAYAKAAGFHIYWLSNQDDAYLSSLFASFADEAVYHNKKLKRFDEELLPYFQAALNDKKYNKKLIILHLYGSHINYADRFPARFIHFPDGSAIDAQIYNQMNQYGASAWTHKQRDDYDNSVLYQDWIFSEIFRRLNQDTAATRSLIFISDHGNEVGHRSNHIGHNANTQAGYRIPIIMWDSRSILPTGVHATQKIDATELSYNLLQLLGLSRKGDKNKSLWTDPNYIFTPPNTFPYWQQK